MNKSLLRSRETGQSIPLIALIIVVLFAMVGLAVDVGNTYAEQRATVRASDAAALSGMSTLIEATNGSSNVSSTVDAGVATAIVNSLKSNKIEIADFANGVGQTSDNRTLTAQYLKADGNPLCYVGAGSGCNLSEVAYIQVKIEGFTSTYFARVVGRPTLPIHAQSFAGKCSPTTGVYPIAVQSSYLDEKGFKAPSNPAEMKYYGIYKDEVYKRGSYQRRIYEKTAVDTSGGFGYVRWKSDPSSGSQTTTAAGLTGDGNLDEGFDEAPWPDGTPLGTKPNGYPLRPNSLNSTDSDWIYANTGVMNALDDKLQTLITNRTRMILPIINGEAGTGNTASYHVQRMGGFILRGYGNESGKGKYFDMVYVGDVNAVACGLTNIVTTTNLGLTGTVFVRPRHTLPPQAHQPVQYTIVLDTSGSMNWNFLGEAKTGSGTIVQCGSSTDAAREAKRQQDISACSSVPKWSPSSERRVAVAKTAIHQFIDLIDTYDAMQIIGFSADDNSGSGVSATTTDWQYGTPAGKQILKDATDAAGAAGDKWTTSGGTPSATGLNEARKLLASAPAKSTDGREFKQVVIFLTDGVANYFLKNSNPGTGFSWRNDGHDNPSCTGRKIDEDTSCQIGFTKTNPSIARPITAMANEAAEIKKLNGGNTQIYVIALAGVTATGLSEVAQQSTFPYYSEATDASQVDDIFKAINDNVENPGCIPAGGDSWLGNIDAQHTVTDSATRTAWGLPADTSVKGYVYLKDTYGKLLKQAEVKVVNDQLSFSFADVSPGTYKVEAFVAYKGDDTPTPVNRLYKWILFPNLSHDTTRTFNVSPSQTLNSVVALDPLYLDLLGNVCP